VPDKLFLWRFSSRPPTWAVVVQFLIALVVMVIGAHFFIGAMEIASHAMAIPAGLISLLLAPLATELPEKLIPCCGFEMIRTRRRLAM
jgi:cation:H+ antiporter